MSTKNKGFASLSKERHLQLSSKGGQAEVPKGLSVLSPEERKKIALSGARARWAKDTKHQALIRKESDEQKDTSRES